MTIKYFRSLWGMHLPTIEENIIATREAGFDGIEYIALPDAAERRAFGDQVKANDLDFILQLGTGAGTGPAIGPESPAEHLHTLESEFLLGLKLDPILVNCHSGRDIFSFDDNLKLVRKTEELEKQHQVPVLLETHRGRASSTVPRTMELLQLVPSLKLTADFSHWTCAHESLLEDQQESMAEILPRVHHIHARVGNGQSPQIRDPRDLSHPADRLAFDAHLDWWKQIINDRRAAGDDTMTITVEFGPPPYYQSEFSAEKLWQINCWMKDFLKQELTN